MKKSILYLLFTVLCLAVTGCNNDDELPKPSFSDITVTPAQSTYHVGDKVTLSVKMLSTLPVEIKAAKYWFYYDYATKAMFVTPTSDTNELVSPEITLTAAGDIELSFWAQFDYPKYQYDGVTKRVVIHVEE